MVSPNVELFDILLESLLLDPNQRIPDWQVPDHLIFSGGMVKGFPGIEQALIIECNGTKNQKGVRHWPIVPVHHILLESPFLLVFHKWMHEGYPLPD